jgi:biotin carboxyl carrier protein
MPLEVHLGKRVATVELIYKEENMVKIAVDDKIYELDMVKVEEGIYSILFNNRSHNIELVVNGSNKKYTVNTYLNTYNVEIVDAETKYLRSREKSQFGEAENRIYSPMPGKVVSIPVQIGEKVKQGQTLIIVSAMKMESEFKAKKDGTVKEILTKEGNTVDGNQTLLLLE